ncbi:hypothetical protein FF38_03046 [Lucilia cuprina]|uniref:Uncharacterized protein n=1 Tax=Lucilia cuprina TaxID=7375 RepID=A0A0L0CEW8_LUCCU|nr:hypothetical protein FF38_03046 [Lucilia cuprina]
MVDFRQFAALFSDNNQFPSFKTEPQTVDARNTGLDDPPAVETSNSGVVEPRSEDGTENTSNAGQLEHRNENAHNLEIQEERRIVDERNTELTEFRSTDAPNTNRQMANRTDEAANTERVQLHDLQAAHTRTVITPTMQPLNTEQLEPQNQHSYNTGWLGGHRTDDNHHTGWMDPRNINATNTAPPDFNHFAALFSGGFFGVPKVNNP